MVGTKQKTCSLNGMKKVAKAEYELRWLDVQPKVDSYDIPEARPIPPAINWDSLVAMQLFADEQLADMCDIERFNYLYLLEC